LQVQLASAVHPLHEAPELAGHATQTSNVDVCIVEYFPAGHRKQVDVAVATEYVHGAHAIQSPVPLVFLYVPTGHAEQAVLSVPVYPGLQIQSVDDIQLSPVTHEAPLFVGQL
jgi:hypothetical protein